MPWTDAGEQSIPGQQLAEWETNWESSELPVDPSWGGEDTAASELARAQREAHRQSELAQQQAEELRNSVPPVSNLAMANITQALGAPHTIVNSATLVTSMLDDIILSQSGNAVASLAVDLEGLHLGRNGGTIYLLQIFNPGSHQLYLVDVCVLKQVAFSIASTCGKSTLRSMLESSATPKFFFGARGDSYALFSEFGIRLQGVQDVQNLHLASRNIRSHRRWRSGLTRVINEHAGIHPDRQLSLSGYKEEGRKFCHRWGYEQFSVRPLHPILIIYASNDVIYLSRAHNNLVSTMSAERWGAADRATRQSIQATQTPNYDPDASANSGAASGWTVAFSDDVVVDTRAQEPDAY
jgi:hypothetical protein